MSSKDTELGKFAIDVWDVLMGNTRFCTQKEFMDKYDTDGAEIDCSTNVIAIGDFRIEIYRKNNEM